MRQELIFEQLLSGPSPITTFLLIKPGAATKHLAKIVRKVVHEGFRIVGLHQAVMTRSLACSFLELDYQVTPEKRHTHTHTKQTGLHALNNNNGYKVPHPMNKAGLRAPCIYEVTQACYQIHLTKSSLSLNCDQSFGRHEEVRQ